MQLHVYYQFVSHKQMLVMHPLFDFDVDKELCGWKSDTKYGWKVVHGREAKTEIGPSSDYSSVCMCFLSSFMINKKFLWIARPNVDNKLCKIPYDEKGLQYYCIPNNKDRRCKDKDNEKNWINCRDG